MFKDDKDLFEIIEDIKININNNRKSKKQSIKDFLLECEKESNKILKEKELLLK